MSHELKTRTRSYALDVIRLYTALPRSPVEQVLGKQFLRAGTSVGANYREACRARSDAEFTAKIGDSLKELEETMYWLELLQDSTGTPNGKLAALIDETNQLTAIFTTITKKVKARGA